MQFPRARVTACPYESIRRRNSPHDVDEQADGHISDLIGEQFSGAGGVDAAAAILDEIDVVGAGAGGDDEAERGEEEEDGGSEGEGGAVEHDGDGRARVEWKRPVMEDKDVFGFRKWNL